MGTIVRHNGFSSPSKYNIVQHKYDCTETKAPIQGFAEVLEIKDPLIGMCGNVIHILWDGKGSTYFEFSNQSKAASAYEAALSLFKTDSMEKVLVALSRQPGYISTSPTVRRPWFYEA